MSVLAENEHALLPLIGYPRAMEIADIFERSSAGTVTASNLTQYTFPVKAQPENCLRCTVVSYMHALS